MNKPLALRLFLGAYVGLLAWHILHDASEFTSLIWTLLVASALFAFWTHKRTGGLLLLFLLIHMALEWIGYGLEGWSFLHSLEEVASLIHIVFDLGLLALLVRTTWPKQTTAILTSTVAGLGVISATAYLVAHDAVHVGEEAGHAHDFAPLWFMAIVLGGIFGCAVYHFFKLPELVAKR